MSNFANGAPAENLVSISSVDKLIVEKISANKNVLSFDINLSANGKETLLRLEGNTKFGKGLNNDSPNSLFFYEGKVDDEPNSWVRLSFNGDVYFGAFYDGYELYFVESLESVMSSLNYTQKNRFSHYAENTQVIYKASDVKNEGMCGLEGHNHALSNFSYQELTDDLNRVTSEIATREIKVNIVADTEYSTVHNGLAIEQMLSEMFIVDGIFSAQLNVQLTLVNSIALSDNGNLTSTDSLGLIQAFQVYVSQQLGNPGITHLFTGKNIDGNVVGIAYINAICSSFGVGLSQSIGANTSLVVAHELGHNFGSLHDDQIINEIASCQVTRPGFLMNPSINGSNNFSQCSLDVMENGIQRGNAFNNNQCVVGITPPVNTAPEITSEPNLNATIGSPYLYDEDGFLDILGNSPFNFLLDVAPSGMAISEDGLITWVPSQEGTEPVQVTVFNDFGEDIQNFEINVFQPLDPAIIDFISTPISSYGGNQDEPGNGDITVEEGGATLNLTGNRWQKISFPYTVTTATMLAFDFKSLVEGEIHGIGFDNNLTFNEAQTFQLYGSQACCISDYSYSGSGDFERFEIPVGQYFAGEMQYLFFVMDHDVPNATGNSRFKNVSVYESDLIVDVTVEFSDELGPNIVAANETFSVQASLTASSTGQLNNIEFSLDQINWFIADETFSYNGFGPLDVGDYVLYVRVNDTEIQSFNFSTQLRAQPAELSYYFLNPRWVGETVTVVGLANNTSIMLSGITQNINEGEVITHTVTAQGEYISGDKSFSIGTTINGLDMPVPASFLGTEFAIPHIRFTHYYDILSPNSDTQVHININGNIQAIDLTQGVVFRFTAGTTTGNSGIITSDAPILVSHNNSSAYDAYPVPPATTELWGVRSRSAYVGAMYDNTNITIYSSNGGEETLSLDAGEIYQVKVGTDGAQGRASAIYIRADKPVSAIQHADLDGEESTSFLPLQFFANRYITPVAAQYIAIACNVTTNVTLYDEIGAVIETKPCNTSDRSPGHVFFGSISNGPNILAGASVEAEAPVYLIYEAAASDDEHNLLGLNDSSIVDLTYIGAESPNNLTNADEFIAQASPTVGNENLVLLIEFSIDGENWFIGEALNGIYQHNFGALDAGSYVLYVRVNNNEILNVDFDIINAPLETDSVYYFLNPRWVGETINISGLANNTSVTLAGITQTINKGEAITHIVTQQGEFISADKPFSVGTSTDGLDMPVPTSFLGTEFAIPHVRFMHYYDILSPYSDAQIEINVNGDVQAVNLTQGIVTRFAAGTTKGNTGVITADTPILVSHNNSSVYDAYPVPPSTTSLWGVRSRNAYIGAVDDNTSITVYASNGSSETLSLDSGELYQVKVGSGGAQGRASAIYIASDKPISAIQHADLDGEESTGFLPLQHFATRYIIPVDSQYVSIVCNATTNLTLFDDSGTAIENTSCISSDNNPGQVLFGTSTSGTNIAAGTIIEAEVPVYLIYETADSDDEHNLLGL